METTNGKTALISKMTCSDSDLKLCYSFLPCRVGQEEDDDLPFSRRMPQSQGWQGPFRPHRQEVLGREEDKVQIVPKLARL